MSARLQSWILRNTTGLQHLVNERLANRPGGIGRLFSYLKIGERQYGGHFHLKYLRLCNFIYVQILQQISLQRQVLSRHIGVGTGPLNYSGLWVWAWCTILLCGSLRFHRAKDMLFFNAQDQPEFWF